MPARKQVTWSELRVGLFVLVALGVLSTFVFYVTGGGTLFTAQAHYVTYLPDVSGLQTGAPVRLAGFAVGAVESVGLSEFRDDPYRHAEVRFRISSEYQNDIRSDSQAFITTEGLLGESVLEITRGVTGQPVPADGAVPGARRGNIKEIVQNVDHITDDVRGLLGDLRAGQGTLGKLFEDPALYNRAYRAVADFQSLTQRTTQGEGTIGKLMVNEELYDQLKTTVDDLAQMATDVRAGKGMLGAMVYDEKFREEARNIVQRADDIIARVQRGEGTIGKLLAEESLHQDIKATFGNVGEITRKMNQGEGTFGRALNDPRLYENINEFTSELRALLSDFRKNPKKYLRIKVSLF